jgi:hypothetical protein
MMIEIWEVGLEEICRSDTPRQQRWIKDTPDENLAARRPSLIINRGTVPGKDCGPFQPQKADRSLM